MMFVDGYGNDVVAIEFARKPGRSPRVKIETPKSPEGIQPAELSAGIGQRDWSQIIGRSRLFDQKLARELEKSKADGSGEITICLHGWFIVAEAGDAESLQPNVVGQQIKPASIRRDAESACAGGLTVPYAFQMADVALKLLPECQSIEKESVRNVPKLLARCNLMRGDRLAAADAMQIVAKIEAVDENRSDQQLKWLLAASARELAPDFIKMLKSGKLYLGVPVGKGPDHASVDGVIVQRERSNDESSMVADISIEFIRQTGEFLVQSYKLSEFRENEE
ncbi:hypothetical protein [Parasphingorhabdus sp.]